ncbi:c-type cytochrome [Chryseobacterium sp. MP_3.2]|uniref:c-type cytochrome n=1 Tax=Chryseobacterium sp. MP_3.2 TaxID=3071712 RepID=UPI002E038DCB|nr:mono/diheme cytochrome c family protein [Chryseobacterium sp. MP_3.2]
MKKLIIILLSTFYLFSCESRTYEEISDQTPLNATIKYVDDVKPIIDANCIICHAPGGSGSFQILTNYNEVKMSIDEIINRIQKPIGDPLKMPQGSTLPPQQIEIIKKWKTDGLLQ